METPSRTSPGYRVWTPDPSEWRVRKTSRLRGRLICLSSCLVIGLLAGEPTLASTDEPVPEQAEVLFVGSSRVDARDLAGRSATMSLGATDKSGPLALGARIQAGAHQESHLETVMEAGRKILRRTTKVSRAGSDDVLATATIDMDAVTLLPLVARTSRQGVESTIEYDWERYVVVRDGQRESAISLDLPMFEVGAHDVWMAALPLTEGFVGRLPMIFAATGTKYWAVPRVVGSEPIDIGDGESREAWVVELDWWGMGAHDTEDNRSSGGGPNQTAGPGGKYWVLKDPPAGVPHVVRIQTEADPSTDRVVQLQGD